MAVNIHKYTVGIRPSDQIELGDISNRTDNVKQSGYKGNTETLPLALTSSALLLTDGIL